MRTRRGPPWPRGGGGSIRKGGRGRAAAGSGLPGRGAGWGRRPGGSDSALTARTWGLAYLQQNQLPRAEAEFRKVVALAPDQALGYANLGLVYLREGRYRDAEAQLRRAAVLDSAASDVDLMLASVYEQTGRETDAHRAIDRVLRRDSTDIRALYALATLAARSADPRERQGREGLLRHVMARAPANIVVRLQLAELLLAGGSGRGPPRGPPAG